MSNTKSTARAALSETKSTPSLKAAKPDKPAKPLLVVEPEPAADDGNDGIDQRIGESARALRKAAGLGLKELAERTGLSTGMISQIERGLSTPSLRSLRLLSVALDVPISHFFEEPKEVRPPSFVVRASERRLLRLSPSGVVKHLISPDGPAVIEMYELELAPGGSSGDHFHRHYGEKAGYVLEGQLQLMLGDEVHVLEQGDAFRFPSVLPHMFSNPSTVLARIIWINASAQG
ncbi:cupin domain-containing protein [Pigmentiphaga aceris]|uniref:Cupin domain-containing protein n=1 Tax=Pigmentiphaga aceris TaxID=1940612 RepID=A0A5C0B149_9BURK|nr:XRE family transcriptional regulator [Pigmentiphaga aceris]QEI08469.1 cupin domain-containing protein [Pigmentiphaga aceris]